MISFDVDPGCVEKNYLECKRTGETRILPLLLDLTNPSPGLGWAHSERDPITDRSTADTVMALALVHHLAIANNVPLLQVARMFSQMGRDLVIEFVDKTDSQVQRLLATREDIFTDYTRAGLRNRFRPLLRNAGDAKPRGDGAHALLDATAGQRFLSADPVPLEHITRPRHRVFTIGSNAPRRLRNMISLYLSCAIYGATGPDPPQNGPGGDG